jgi:hypothetical protein
MIYDSLVAAKKFEPKYRLTRVRAACHQIPTHGAACGWREEEGRGGSWASGVRGGPGMPVPPRHRAPPQPRSSAWARRRASRASSARRGRTAPRRRDPPPGPTPPAPSPRPPPPIPPPPAPHPPRARGPARRAPPPVPNSPRLPAPACRPPALPPRRACSALLARPPTRRVMPGSRVEVCSPCRSIPAGAWSQEGQDAGRGVSGCPWIAHGGTSTKIVSYVYTRATPPRIVAVVVLRF